MIRESKQKLNPKDERNLAEVIEFIPRHVENIQVGHGVQERNSATNTLCHEFAELSETFV